MLFTDCDVDYMVDLAQKINMPSRHVIISIILAISTGQFSTTFE